VVSGPTRPTIGILAVQGDVREHARALEALGARPVSVRRANELDGIQGLVIPHWETLLNIAARCHDLTGLGYLGVDLVLFGFSSTILIARWVLPVPEK
jgi:hypothetical protein